MTWEQTLLEENYKGELKGRAEGKAEIALNLHKMGMPDIDIAKAVEVSLETVRQWLKDKAI